VKTGPLKAIDARRITAADMKYMRKTAGYISTDYKTDSKRTQYSPSFGQNAQIQKKFVATYK